MTRVGGLEGQTPPARHPSPRVLPGLGEHTVTAPLIDWENAAANDFPVSEEVGGGPVGGAPTRPGGPIREFVRHYRPDMADKPGPGPSGGPASGREGRARGDLPRDRDSPISERLSRSALMTCRPGTTVMFIRGRRFD